MEREYKMGGYKMAGALFCYMDLRDDTQGGVASSYLISGMAFGRLTFIRLKSIDDFAFSFLLS